MVILLLLVLLSPAHAADHCTRCAKIAKTVSAIDTEKNRLTKLLGENREYLAYVKASSASKFLKATSNEMATLDALENQKEKEKILRDEFRKIKCFDCNKEETKDEK